MPNPMESRTASSSTLRLVAATVFAGLVAIQTGCQMAATGHNLQGVRHYQAGQYDQALQRFQLAATTQPRNGDAFYNMAATFHRQGIERSDTQSLEQAEALYNQCLDVHPNHSECYRALAVLLVETKRSDRAFTLLKNWARDNPELAQPRIELARLYEEFGDRETAEHFVIDALRKDPSNALAYKSLGHLYELKNQPTLALQNYQRSFQLNRMQPTVSERIASISRSLQGQPLTGPNGGRYVNNPNTGVGTRY